MAVRVTNSLVYAAWAGWLVGTEQGGGSIRPIIHLLSVCLAATIASLAFDWQVGPNASGSAANTSFRAAATATGVLIGIGNVIAAAADGNIGTEVPWGPFTVSEAFGPLPVLMAAGWIIGSAVDREIGTAAHSVAGSHIAQTQRFLWPLSWLGAVAAIGTTLVYNLTPVYAGLVAAFGVPEHLPQIDLFGLWGNPEALVCLGMLAVALHYSASHLAARSAILGWCVCVAAPALGVLLLLIDPTNPATWFIDELVSS